MVIIINGMSEFLGNFPITPKQPRGAISSASYRYTEQNNNYTCTTTAKNCKVQHKIFHTEQGLPSFAPLYGRYSTVNPLYNDIHYNSKIRYNVNSVCTKISGSCIFFHWYSHVILQENIHFVYFLELPQRGDSNKYTKRMIHKNCSKVSVIDASDGSISSFFITANSI